MSLIVNDIIDMTRFQLDESSTIAVSDAEITRVLNRGQRKAANIFARKNDSLFWTSADTTTTSGQRNYTLPDEAYGERIEMVEVLVGGIPRKLTRISRAKASPFIGNSTTARPSDGAITLRTCVPPKSPRRSTRCTGAAHPLSPAG